MAKKIVLKTVSFDEFLELAAEHNVLRMDTAFIALKVKSDAQKRKH